MKAILDPSGALQSGLEQLGGELELPREYPADAVSEAVAAASRPLSDHVDRTAWPFVTLDPASSTDLDQAFHIEPSTNGELLLHYAIADVGWFVRPDGAVDKEAWSRGMTQYLPGGRVPLYPPVLSEAAASLLPDGPRPAVIFTVSVAADGEVRLVDVERGLIRSRAKLGYETVRPEDLPPLLPELARRVRAAEAARGAARIDPPQQELSREADGQYTLVLKPQLPAELDNATLSLATNLAVARLFLDAKGGLFRVMAEPDERAVARLRASAQARGIAWPAQEDLPTLERRLDATKPEEAAFMLEIRKASRGASYAPWRDAARPWHAAVAASYVHATAPLRRLADRYVVEAALSLSRSGQWPDDAARVFAALPRVMDAAGATAGRLTRASLDLAEAVLLEGREGETFSAVVTEAGERGTAQLLDLPVVTRIDAEKLARGATVNLRLESADPGRRETRFSPA